MLSPDFTLLQKYSLQVPRYTSYPTAPHFKSLSSATYADWLAHIHTIQPISLYLHIPYCEEMCWFCGCHTQVTKKYEAVAAYLEMLYKEIKMVASSIGRMQPVSHIHFGGGSPTLLEGKDFCNLMELIRAHFTIRDNCEIAVEIDPRTVNEEKIAAYSRSGVNRVSIGVQDFNEKVQKAINRIQPFSCVDQAIRMCHTYGINHINLDLVYGLPYQTTETFLRTLEYTLLFDPSRIALFGYAHVPWKKKNMRLIEEKALPDTHTRYLLFKEAAEYLHKSGYMTIGLDHFVKPSDSMATAYKNATLQRNFQGYTTDAAYTLIGFGASAISSFPQGYIQNVPAVAQYKGMVASDQLPTTRGYTLTLEDRLRRSIIEQLMCYYKVDIKAMCRLYNVPASCFDTPLKNLANLLRDGLIEIDSYTLKVSHDFPQIVRLVCAAFDTFYVPQEMQHAQVA